MNKVTFRCKRSGNTVSFTSEHDIAGLRKHEEYEEVQDVETPKTIENKPQQTSTEEVLKPRMGRPRKIPAFLQE